MKLLAPFCLITSASALSSYMAGLSQPTTTSSSPAPWGRPIPSAPATRATPAAPSARVIGPSQDMLELLGKQVSVELMASQQYMQASIWLRSRNMDGMAAWMLEESDEERGHCKEILEFAMKNHYEVVLEPLSAPKNDWNSVSDVWATILSLKENNTQNLLRIAGTADSCGMCAVKAFLNPFHVEQIDAEDKVGAILAKVKGASGALLWEIDHQLGKDAAAEHVPHGYLI